MLWLLSNLRFLAINGMVIQENVLCVEMGIFDAGEWRTA